MSNKGKIALASLAAAAVVAGASAVRADTITVQNFSQNVATGEYQYVITFDSKADVQDGDGFVLYDWPGLVTTGPDAPAFTNPGPGGVPSATFAQFVMSQSNTSNNLTDSGDGDTAQHVADEGGSSQAGFEGIPFDTSVPNLTFNWTGTPYLAGGPTGQGATTAILTLYSTLLGGDTNAVYASVDRSGTDPGVSYGQADGTIFAPVPAATGVPLPMTSVTGAALLAAVGLNQMRRSRRNAKPVA